jgi:hypothetical protein
LWYSLNFPENGFENISKTSIKFRIKPSELTGN